MSAQRILISTVSGFIAGIAVGLMVAPASGSETRQRIADSASDLAGTVKDKAGNLKGKVQDKINSYRNKAEDNLNDLELETDE